MKKSAFLVAILIIGISALLVNSCNSVYTPKPRGYFKITFPEHRYQVFDKPGVPFTFEYPVYARVVQDSSFFGEQPDNPYWFNVNFPDYSGTIYISYIAIGGKSRYKVQSKNGQYVDSIGINTLEHLVKGSYTLTYKHSTKASSIEDSAFTNPAGVEGIFFRIGGDAATANQFLVTDSVKHFLRGALYFDATPNEDSLSIVNRFLQTDMKHMINTLQWR